MKTLTTEQIKARLQEVGMTQKQLAEKLEMQPARLSEMINGKREMPEELAAKIRAVLEMKNLSNVFGQGHVEETEKDLQDDARQFAQDDPGIKEVRLGDKIIDIDPTPDNNILEVIIDLIQTRRYLGLRHKKRLIEDLKGLEL